MCSAGLALTRSAARRHASDVAKFDADGLTPAERRKAIFDEHARKGWRDSAPDPLVEWSRLPAIYPLKAFVEAGALMSYGSGQSEHGRGLAGIADRILKGAKPGDIPVFLRTKFETGGR